MIPRILHQTWKDHELPERFAEARQSWLDRHPDWEHRLWTDEDLADFVREEFPELWPLYERYPDHIQRVDAARYLILSRLGGVYSDLDIFCIRPFDRFLEHEAVLAPSDPWGFSNDLMLSRPGHPLFEDAVRSLERAFWQWQWPVIPRHFRVLGSTGSIFLSRVAARHPGSFEAMSPVLYRSNDPRRAAVLHIEGNTWMGWDSHLILRLYGRGRRRPSGD